MRVPNSRRPSRAEDSAGAVDGVQVALDSQNARRKAGGPGATGHEGDEPCPPEKQREFGGVRKENRIFIVVRTHKCEQGEVRGEAGAKRNIPCSNVGMMHLYTPFCCPLEYLPTGWGEISVVVQLNHPPRQA